MDKDNKIAPARSHRAVSPHRRHIIGKLVGTASAGVIAACATDAVDRIVQASTADGQLFWADTQAELRASAGGGSRTVAVLRGTDAIGDGGGGMFTWTSDTTTPDDGGTVLAVTTGRTGCWKRVYGRDEVYPEWWSASGLAPDTAGRSVLCQRIQKAIDTGRNVVLTGIYDLGTTSVHGTAFLRVIGKKGQKIVGRGSARLSCATSGGGASDTIPRLIEISNSSFIEIDNIEFTDTAVSDSSYLNVPRVGAAAVHLAWAAAGETRNISLRNLHCHHLIHTLVVARDGGNYLPRIHSITVDNVRSEMVRYGINCQNNGDNLTVRNFRTLSNVRDYIIYGVRFHDVEIYSSGPLSNGDTYAISRFEYDTKNIKLRARVEDRPYQETALLSLGHGQHAPSSTALISDIDIDLDMRDAVYGRLIEFRSGDLSGQAEATTVNRWENIRISGVDVNKDTVIKWTSVPLTKVGLELSPLTYDFARLANGSTNITRNFTGCYLAGGPGRRIYFSQGKLSANPVVINLKALGFTYQMLTLRLRVSAIRDTVTNTARIFQEDAIFALVSDPNVSIHQVNRISKFFMTQDASTGTNAGGDGGVTYAVSGADLLVQFPNYNGNSDNGVAAVELVLF